MLFYPVRDEVLQEYHTLTQPLLRDLILAERSASPCICEDKRRTSLNWSVADF